MGISGSILFQGISGTRSLLGGYVPREAVSISGGGGYVQRWVCLGVAGYSLP